MAKNTNSPDAPTPTIEAAPSGRPDAVKIPHAYGRNGLPVDAQDGMVSYAEKLLGVDKAKGERALCRNQDGYVFATRDRLQRLKFPERHRLKGQPRYAWVDRGDGVQVGTLVEEARGDG